MKGEGHAPSKSSQKESRSHVPRRIIVRKESQVLEKIEKKDQEDALNGD